MNFCILPYLPVSRAVTLAEVIQKIKNAENDHKWATQLSPLFSFPKLLPVVMENKHKNFVTFINPGRNCYISQYRQSKRQTDRQRSTRQPI